jgi:hypothetical protein
MTLDTMSQGRRTSVVDDDKDEQRREGGKSESKLIPRLETRRTNTGGIYR